MPAIVVTGVVVPVVVAMLHGHRVGTAIVMAIIIIPTLGESLAQRRDQKR
jgi:hypothetical protein